MTLLLAAERPYPFLLADLLVTERGKGTRTEIPLPSVGTVPVNTLLQRNSPFPDRLSFSSLTTKLCSINRYLVVGCAGSQILAASLIQRLQAEIGSDPIDCHSLEGLISPYNDRLKERGFRPLQVIALGIDRSMPDGYLSSYNCRRVQSPFGRTAIGGRGANVALELLSIFGGNAITGLHPSYPADEEIHRFSSGMGWAGILTLYEKMTSRNYAHAFGAGFEVASIIDDEVKKADNFNTMQVVIRNARHNTDEYLNLEMAAPITLSRQFYDEGGNLIIVRMVGGGLRVSKNGNSNGMTKEENYFFIKRFGSEVDVGKAVAPYSWKPDMLMGGKYTTYLAAHVTDRLQNMLVGVLPAEMASVEVNLRGTVWCVVYPLPFKTLREIVERLGM